MADSSGTKKGLNWKNALSKASEAGESEDISSGPSISFNPPKVAEMIKLHKGGRIKKSGPYRLLKGEVVISKEDVKRVEKRLKQRKSGRGTGRS